MKGKFLARNWGYLFVVVPIMLQLIFFFYPLLRGFMYSLTNWSGLTRNYDYIGFENFVRIFSDNRFITSIQFTVVFTLALIIGEIVIGLAVALLLNEKIPAVGFFRTAYFFPAVLSTVTVGLIFNQLFNYGLPQIGEWLNIEWLQGNLLASPKTVVWGVIFVALWQGVAMPIIIFLAGIQSIPTDITEAAQIDGANKWELFFKIKLPYLLPSVSMVFILALKSGLTAFDNIYALTGGGPQNKTTSLGLLVYNTAFKTNEVGYANAIAVVLFIIIVVISVLQMRISKKFEL
ncbi:sugar ABC transporter permease [Aerococcaceae bacterium zg-ZJ1578]|uniref:carbohydrate ABC transporter permease n=1 Tax=Aerococcaceae TaxID=186827 RepID=UPI0013BD5DC4|nr:MULTISPECIES: sugar ABC transporter permease [unclassified Facklamia]MBK0347443.1 sugar ABC transporter permease [Aerococcaceae bacterium zg-1578]MBS4461534.1 sugar ABC transporter permease [Aerococcaceae bacterium zg-B36]QQD65179.1 sugar ABC transporter permease [Aerococcaceae bacterium zg-252]NEW63827.1 ABC transporter permease subunit [Facklamia sp. 252]NEW67298.1 ABC transporter permease subunit [Facklamia sp. 253]